MNVPQKKRNYSERIRYFYCKFSDCSFYEILPTCFCHLEMYFPQILLQLLFECIAGFELYSFKLGKCGTRNASSAYGGLCTLYCWQEWHYGTHCAAGRHLNCLKLNSPLLSEDLILPTVSHEQRVWHIALTLPANTRCELIYYCVGVCVCLCIKLVHKHKCP